MCEVVFGSGCIDYIYICIDLCVYMQKSFRKDVVDLAKRFI